VSLAERYHLDRIRNRSAEMIHEAVERLFAEQPQVCRCEECALDLVAYALNRVTPRYSTSLLEPLAPDPALERRIRLEIDLALAAGVKRLKEHPHHD
jgi:competence protein ComFB